ncbi:MAG: hypothetical protein AAFQ98_21320 [Bacteroidota bacterium]
MNFFATILAFAFIGQGSTVESIVPEGMDYNEYLSVQFHSEEILDVTSLTNPEDRVVIYNAAGELVAEGDVAFIGDIVDTQDQELFELVNKSDYMMGLGNTRIYQLNK